jgi:hypothetical protein
MVNFDDLRRLFGLLSAPNVGDSLTGSEMDDFEWVDVMQPTSSNPLVEMLVRFDTFAFEHDGFVVRVDRPYRFVDEDVEVDRPMMILAQVAATIIEAVDPPRTAVGSDASLPPPSLLSI